MRPLIHITTFSAWWGEKQILDSIHLNVFEKNIFTLIGPSGSGKSTMLRCLNRLNEGMEGWRTQGEIQINGIGKLSRMPLVELRRHMGMVFQKPIIFPCSILDNVVFGFKHTQRPKPLPYPELAEKVLKDVHLWEEVKDRLHKPARQLSLGQQQRLCLARALVLEPKILLLDEPTASLDARSTEAIEQTLRELKSRFSLVLVTHNLAQARRLSDHVAYLSTQNGKGTLIETGLAHQVFTAPKQPLTATFLGT